MLNSNVKNISASTNEIVSVENLVESVNPLETLQGIRAQLEAWIIANEVAAWTDSTLKLFMPFQAAEQIVGILRSVERSTDDTFNNIDSAAKLAVIANELNGLAGELAG